MSIELDERVVPADEDDYVEDAWQLKERIRRAEGILKQRRGFFEESYRRARVYLLFEDEDLVGFAAVRGDGYILFLAVDVNHRGKGLGRRLVGTIANAYPTVTCHARESNEDAIEFYKSLGFEEVRFIENYYEDGGNAYYLQLGESAGLTDRLSGFLG